MTHCGVALMLTFALAAEDWPQFRGPRGDGSSLETALPLHWSPTENIRWKVPAPGSGHSSPIVSGNRVFLTAFEPDRSALGWIAGNHGHLLVLCFDRDTGTLVWRQEVVAKSIERVSNGNTPATPTPATDGVRLFVYFGSYGLTAFDFNGRKLWSVELGPYLNHMGSASSPILAGNTLLLNCETDGPDFLLAVDKFTGRTLWKTNRKQKQAGYSTPVVWNRQVIVEGNESVRAYSLSSGRELWSIGGMTSYVVPTPVIARNLAIVSSAGPGGSALIALHEDGSIAWRNDRAAAYVASPAISGELLFTVKDNGVMSCLDNRSGALRCQQRLPIRGTYFSSPIVAEGRIYISRVRTARQP